jgi:hypothetical protein
MGDGRGCIGCGSDNPGLGSDESMDKGSSVAGTETNEPKSESADLGSEYC